MKILDKLFNFMFINTRERIMPLKNNVCLNKSSKECQSYNEYINLPILGKLKGLNVYERLNYNNELNCFYLRRH